MQTIILSSAGLRNMLLSSDYENEFRFIFGTKEIKTYKILAEFISPIVSRLHHADHSIDSICFNDFFINSSQLSEELIDEKMISLFQRISKGYSIEINKEEGFKLQLISILIGNEELFSKVNEIYPIEISEENLNLYIENLAFLHNYSRMSTTFNYPVIIDFIASHFYMINIDMLIKLPKSIIYSIISNRHLKIESEDSLFDIIQNIFTNQSENSEDCIDIISFYEEIDFSGLSESKFRDFLNKFDFNEMTGLIWAKLRQCFHFTSLPFLKNNQFNSERYLYKGKCYEFDEEKKNYFKGVIHHLTKETGGNVNDNGTILVTASSVCNGHFPKYAVDLDDNLHYFQSVAMQDSWLKYDFKDRKIRPSKYSIRTRHDCDQGGYHPMNWVIECSNTDDDWKIVDSRKDVKYLDDCNAVHVFDVQVNLSVDEFYRYIRIRQTGVNTGNNYTLPLSALEFFGILD